MVCLLKRKFLAIDLRNKFSKKTKKVLQKSIHLAQQIMYRRRRRGRKRRQRGGINPAAILAARKAGRMGIKAGKFAMKYGLPILAPYLAHKGINLMNKRLKR